MTFDARTWTGPYPAHVRAAYAEGVAFQEERAMTRAYMPSSKTTEHETPRDLFDALDGEFGPFTCDPACMGTEHSAYTVDKRGGLLCIPPDLPEPEHFALNETYYRRDGLTARWRGRVFLNPPYGRGVERWIAKAVSEVQEENVELVCALVKATTDVKWWQEYVIKEAAYDRMAAHELLELVRFLPGRLRFGGQAASAPFPSAVAVWQIS